MLTGTQVRVRHGRDRRITPIYIDENDDQWRSMAENMLLLYREATGRTRSELEEEVSESIGDTPTQLVNQGLAKLLEDRCEFEVESTVPPEEIREKIFLAAATSRINGDFSRDGVLSAVGTELGLTPEQIDRGLFADLKMEQRLIGFDDITAENLLRRYNVALAQAVLLRSTGVTITITGESPARYRQLFRAVKFHRLICEIQSASKGSQTLRLDGPLSLFSATQKYGMQLANFLPSLLLCKSFQLKAEVRWGAERKEKVFLLESGDGLHSHKIDHGDYTPKELTMFAEMFQAKIDDWDIAEETAILPAGKSFWLPDFCLVHRKSGKRVYLEILGYWRKTDVEKSYRNLRENLKEPFLLAVSEQFNIEEEMADVNQAIYRFKRTPLPEEIVKMAAGLLG
ncbi:MAG: DUF790 family protein [Planctomycetes bacterium]|nr:DUF790 family protein [Planctomycetota bacterium]